MFNLIKRVQVGKGWQVSNIKRVYHNTPIFISSLGDQELPDEIIEDTAEVIPSALSAEIVSPELPIAKLQPRSLRTSKPTLVIDLSVFLLATSKQLDGLPSDRHSDCSLALNTKRVHSRPYFEDFLQTLC